MATNPYTATYLLAALKRRGMLAAHTDTLTDADFLAFADEELQSEIVPFIMSMREKYFSAYADVTTTAGTAAYALPKRAIGGKLRHVAIADGTAYRALTWVEPESVEGDTSTGAPTSYSIRGNDVVLYPAPSAAVTLRMHYYQRPSRLVATTAVGRIATISGNRLTLTMAAALPATFTSGEYYDVVKGSGPGFETLQIDNYATGSATPALTLTTAAPASVAVGDFVCLSGETPIPQIPVELHPWLAQRVVLRALEALGDPKAAVAEKTADRMRKVAATLLAPRVDADPRVIINRNGPGFGRRQGR